ncbi:hypothetical protein Brsp06_00490 [Brucella sp. NBRC 13694]|nr:hypothetical protein [Brucella anthropi]NIH73472.1 hypothetical protein [Ochrobactrum sp. P20RRXII]
MGLGLNALTQQAGLLAHGSRGLKLPSQKLYSLQWLPVARLASSLSALQSRGRLR